MKPNEIENVLLAHENQTKAFIMELQQQIHDLRRALAARGGGESTAAPAPGSGPVSDEELRTKLASVMCNLSQMRGRWVSPLMNAKVEASLTMLTEIYEGLKKHENPTDPKPDPK